MASALPLLLAAPALAAPRIYSIDPTTVAQGETVLITIKGTELPVGNLRLEFFPQQIVVVNAQLSSAPDELTAQIRVPQTATPGAYNLMLSNQRGEEVFAQSLLTVTSTVRTPVFRSYDPKVIARADSGFALLLQGDSITPETPGQLSIAWEQNEKPVGGLQTVFNYSAGNILAAVTGRLPTGMLRGRISMGGKAIYQFEIEVRGGTAVIGHVPGRLNSAEVVELKLVGDDLSSSWLSRAKITLRAGKREVAAARVGLRDTATAVVEFLGPLPTGDYTLAVSVEDVAIYQGTVTVLPPLPVAPAPPVEPEVLLPERSGGQLTVVPRPAQVVTEYEVVEPEVTLPEPTVPEHNVQPEIIDTAEPPIGLEMTEVRVNTQPVSGRARITSATFAPGANGAPGKLLLSGDSLAPELLETLQVEIVFKGKRLLPDLSTATDIGFSYLFSTSGALPGATVMVRDPTGIVPAFRQELGRAQPTKVATPAGPVVTSQPTPYSPQTGKAPVNDPITLEGSVGIDTRGFALTLLSAGSADWSNARLSSAHPILAPNVDKFTLDAPLSGSRTLLRLNRDAAALPDAVYRVLCDMLVDSASVPLTFAWSDGRSIELEATFVRELEQQAEGDEIQATSGML